MSANPLSAAERALLEAVRTLRFGSIEAVVHDGRLVRIEKVEKIRIDPDPVTGGLGAAADSTDGERPHERSVSMSLRGGPK